MSDTGIQREASLLPFWEFHRSQEAGSLSLRTRCGLVEGFSRGRELDSSLDRPLSLPFRLGQERPLPWALCFNSHCSGPLLGVRVLSHLRPGAHLEPATPPPTHSRPNFGDPELWHPCPSNPKHTPSACGTPAGLCRAPNFCVTQLSPPGLLETQLHAVLH